MLRVGVSLACLVLGPPARSRPVAKPPTVVWVYVPTRFTRLHKEGEADITAIVAPVSRAAGIPRLRYGGMPTDALVGRDGDTDAPDEEAMCCGLDQRMAFRMARFPDLLPASAAPPAAGTAATEMATVTASSTPRTERLFRFMLGFPPVCQARMTSLVTEIYPFGTYFTYSHFRWLDDLNGAYRVYGVLCEEAHLTRSAGVTKGNISCLWSIHKM